MGFRSIFLSLRAFGPHYALMWAAESLGARRFNATAVIARHSSAVKPVHTMGVSKHLQIVSVVRSIAITVRLVFWNGQREKALLKE